MSDKGLEVVFVSFDRSKADMEGYMKECHGDWWAVQSGAEEGQKLAQARANA